MWHTVVSLQCALQSMQGVHCVIEGFSLFDVVSGYVKQLPCPQGKRFLSLSNAVWESGLINLKECGLVQIPPRSAAQRFRAACIHNFPCVASQAGLKVSRIETSFEQWEQHKRRFTKVCKNEKASTPRGSAITLDLLR